MDFVIRLAEIGDAAAIARVHIESWKTTYAGIVPDAFLASLNTEERTQGWREQISNDASLTFVAEDGAGIVGFVSGGAIREPVDDYDAELCAIYLLREGQRLGAGRMLCHVLASGLRDIGFTSLVVWVLEANPAVSFYERLGGTRVARKMIEIGGVDLSEIALGWREMDRLIESG